MDAQEPSRRRWQSHEWNVLAVVAIVAAIGLGWLGMEASTVRHRRAMRAQIEASGGRVFTPGLLASIDGDISKVRRMLGDEFTHQIFLPRDSALDQGEVAKTFPEARIVQFAPRVR
jgi:hypothetical protein